MKAQRYDVLIVGSGHGGAQTAISLRQLGFDGSIGLLSRENHPPYQRPPLSKEYLSGGLSFDRILLRPLSFWSGHVIDLLCGLEVTAVDAPAHRVRFANGAALEYERLVWATGAMPRRLTCTGHDLAGVHALRSLDDVDAMIQELPAAGHVVIVGGGYIGLEVAVALRKLGKSITVLEALDRVLARVAGRPLSRFIESEHHRHGVDIQLGVTIDCIHGEGGRATAVQLADGRVLNADMVVVGIGISPAVSPLLEAGAAGGDGVDVDEYCRSSLTDIYAIGDCARHANSFAGGQRVRLESVQNASDQAGTAAKAIVGAPEPYGALPWFWSNQYDLRLQTVGLSIGHDETIIRGAPADRSFSVIYLKEGCVIALDCVNATKDYVHGRALVAARAAISRTALADASRPLADLRASATITHC
jgi:3-phenylpropionate/trans-cinnamate dioxygenase ferredoxin reductase subunit